MNEIEMCDLIFIHVVCTICTCLCESSGVHESLKQVHARLPVGTRNYIIVVNDHQKLQR
jgi:hypothetical protein